MKLKGECKHILRKYMCVSLLGNTYLIFYSTCMYVCHIIPQIQYTHVGVLFFCVVFSYVKKHRYIPTYCTVIPLTLTCIYYTHMDMDMDIGSHILLGILTYVWILYFSIFLASTCNFILFLSMQKKKKMKERTKIQVFFLYPYNL